MMSRDKEPKRLNYIKVLTGAATDVPIGG